MCKRSHTDGKELGGISTCPDDVVAGFYHGGSLLFEAEMGVISDTKEF